jgi:hypothetical protein
MQFIAYDNRSINRLDFYNFGTMYWNSGLSLGCPVKGMKREMAGWEGGSKYECRKSYGGDKPY